MLIAHSDHFCPLLTSVLLFVKPPVMIFRLHHHGGPAAGAIAAGWEQKDHDNKD
jgi:hypothetical protein